MPLPDDESEWPTLDVLIPTYNEEREILEITLLGQNVNSWGRDLAPDVQTHFGELLRACDAVSGIERLRFTSPHPKDFRESVVAALAELQRASAFYKCLGSYPAEQ